MFTIQFMDYEEGSAKRWNELSNSRFDTKEKAREHLRSIIIPYNIECLYSYRVVEVGSDVFYSQPTDVLEY